MNLIRAWELDGTCFSNALSKVKTTDSLVVLGGSMNAYADTEYPWLKAVRELLVRRPREKWVTAEDKLAKPTSETESAGKTLGICLGHQLAAVAFGGSVEVGALQPAEKSIIQIQWRPHELSEILNHPRYVFADHNDRVGKVPAQATVIAENKNGVQALSYGENYLTVQFHPEVNEQVLYSWFKESEPENLNTYLEDYSKKQALIAETSRKLASWLVE